MPIIDFKEIPEANKSTGKQDSFELFARDFFEALGYTIEEYPDRGPDGGRDLIMIEPGGNVEETTVVRWLVSCKHKAHYGKSVVLKDEPDIIERLQQHNCDGFIGFYSTVPASSLTNRLEGLTQNSNFHKFKYQIFDCEKIEKELLSSLDSLKIAERYFPNSYKQWKRENSGSADLFKINDKLVCQDCGKPLLEPPTGILVMMYEILEIDGRTKQ
jgi:hypothetical protein